MREVKRLKIWKIENEVDYYKGFSLKNEKDIDLLKNNFDKGQPIKEWMPLSLKPSDDNKGVGDCPQFWSYSNLLMVSKRAKDIISRGFRGFIEFLPVEDTVNNDTYYLANILNQLDEIDYDKSEFRKLMDIYIVEVTKYVFKDNARNIPIFKIYLDGVLMTTDMYVNDEFKNLIEDSELEGFKFTEVFDFEA